MTSPTVSHMSGDGFTPSRGARRQYLSGGKLRWIRRCSLGRGYHVFHTTWRREYGIGHVIWCYGQASQVQLLHSSSPPFLASLSHFMYSVPAVFVGFFLRAFPDFPAGYRMFPCLWAPIVNTQSARHFPSTIVWTSLYLFIALVSLAWPVLYAQVGVGSFV